MKTFRMLVPFSMVALLGGCGTLGDHAHPEILQSLLDQYALPAVTVIKPDVKLVAHGNGPDRELLILAGPNHRCRTTTHVGCIRTPRNAKAEIRFQLYGIPSWNMTRIQLVTTDAKLDFGTPGNFPVNLATDFYVEVGNVEVHPDADGIISLGAGGTREFVLHNLNNFEETYRYQVEACQGATCRVTDPRFENEGTD